LQHLELVHRFGFHDFDLNLVIHLQRALLPPNSFPSRQEARHTQDDPPSSVSILPTADAEEQIALFYACDAEFLAI
jgi:hypothetical protein